jgi:hypothetical protein
VAARPILVNVITAVSGKGIEDAQKKLTGLGGSLDKLSSKALKAGASFVAFQGGQIIADFASDAVVQARDLERNIAALDTVFGEYAETMRGFTVTSQEFGLSQSEAAKAVTFIGSVLKQSGFGMEEVAEVTQRLVRLGSDLSITFGYDVQEALLGMTALFRGEYDPIEKFGVAMKQAEVNAGVAALGLGELTLAEERLAEQQVRLNLLFERSTDAQGQFARQTGSLYAEQQKLEAAINNMLQNAGTPLLKTMADLAAAMTPLINEITPTLVAQFERFVPVGASADEVAQELVGTIKGLIETLGLLAEVFVKITVFLAENTKGVLTFVASVAAYKGLTAVILPVAAAFTMTGTAIEIATAKAKLFKMALARTGIGLIAVAVGTLAAGLMMQQEAQEGANEETRKANQALETYKQALRIASASNGTMRMETEKLNAAIRILGASAGFAAGEMNRFSNALDTVIAQRVRKAQEGVAAFQNTTFTGAGGAFGLIQQLFPEAYKEKEAVEAKEKVRNFVQEFFANLQDEAKKVSAAARLESLGASPALIDSIVNFGEGWEKVFNNIVKGGRTAVQELQELFDSTAAGIEELEKIQADFDKQVQDAAEKRFERLEKEYQQAKDFADAMAKAADDARDSFSDFFSAFDILPTVSSDIGKFEQQTISALASINEELERTLESFITEGGDSLFQTAYQNLKAYADKELGELRRIQRERDALAARRSIVESVTEDIMRAGNVVQLLANINQKLDTNRDKTTKVIQDTVTAGKRLKDFRVSLITNLVEPLDSVGNKADMLVSSYRSVVERTRTFVENLRALRQLGLDPQLFNQLVEAGVEAGGETAQALIDGGSKTVDEINNLTRDLNQLGAEIGAETADVMYATGETFINSILAGIQSQQDALESQARAMAEAFSRTFKSNLDLAVGTIAAEAAVSVPPPPQMEKVVNDISGSLNQLDALQRAARQFGESTKNATFALGAQAKEEIYEVLENALRAGANVDLSGIRSGMSTEELLSAAKTAAPTVVFNIGEVNASGRAEGKQATDALIQTITQTVRRNGSIATLVSGQGQVAL